MKENEREINARIREQQSARMKEKKRKIYHRRCWCERAYELCYYVCLCDAPMMTLAMAMAMNEMTIWLRINCERAEMYWKIND